jgi:hypothetical protein
MRDDDIIYSIAHSTIYYYTIIFYYTPNDKQGQCEENTSAYGSR